MKISKKALVSLAGPTALAVVALFIPTSSASAQSINDGVKAAQGSSTQTNLFGVGGIFTTIVNVLLFIIGAISVIMLIYGGIRYTLSGGDSGSVTSAKNTIMYAIIGLVIAFLAFAIVNWVLGALAGNASTT